MTIVETVAYVLPVAILSFIAYLYGWKHGAENQARLDRGTFGSALSDLAQMSSAKVKGPIVDTEIVDEVKR